MSYEKVRQAKEIIIGTKQTVKALKSDHVKEVVLATDADDKIRNKIVEAAQEKQVPILYVDSMTTLGKVCGIDVKAATVAIIR